MEKPVELVPLDMSLSVKHRHPDIIIGKQYLARIKGRYYVGTFSEVWFGLSFYGWYGVPLQFDAPGTNVSMWEQIWEIVEVQKGVG